MQLSEVYVALGEEQFSQVLRQISIGKLKTFQLYERLKIRLHLAKLNGDSLRKGAPRFLGRLREHDEELATELAQAVLISHLDMIKEILTFLGVPHEEGFFAKDLDAAPYLTEGWQERAFVQFKGTYPVAVLLFYINHLSFELTPEAQLFIPVAA